MITIIKKMAMILLLIEVLIIFSPFKIHYSLRYIRFQMAIIGNYVCTIIIGMAMLYHPNYDVPILLQAPEFFDNLVSVA